MAAAASQTKSAKNNAYLEVKFLGPNRTLVSVKGLLDSGNLTCSSAAMSLDLARQLQLPIHPTRIKVGTAARNGSLKVLGICKDVRMMLNQNLIVTLSKVIILENLNNDLNLSLQFLKQTKARWHFAKKKLLIAEEELTVVTQMVEERKDKTDDENAELEAHPIGHGTQEECTEIEMTAKE